MKIVFIGSPYDPSNPLKKESVAYYMSEAFQRNGVEVINYVPNKYPLDFFLKIKKLLLLAFNQSFYYERTNLIQKYLANQINDFLKNTNHDHVFSFGSMPHAYVNHKKPFSYWTDATYKALLNYYKSYSNINSKNGDVIFQNEKNVIQKASFMFFASDWAARSAIEDYDANPEKVFTIPLGANLPYEPDYEIVLESLTRKSNKKLNLLWIGYDWKRKGGDLLVELAKYYKMRNIDFNINVVGTKQEVGREIRENFTFHGPLRKNVKGEFKKLEELFYQSHFHFLMTKAEAFGHVFAEANAYGVPNIASRTGGVSSAVKAGKSGFLFKLDTSIKDIAEFILKKFNNKEEYNEICLSSRQAYEEKFNWDSGIKEVIEKIS